jgi:hypothetical protein
LKYPSVRCVLYLQWSEAMTKLRSCLPRHYHDTSNFIILGLNPHLLSPNRSVQIYNNDCINNKIYLYLEHECRLGISFVAGNSINQKPPCHSNSNNPHKSDQCRSLALDPPYNNDAIIPQFPTNSFSHQTFPLHSGGLLDETFVGSEIASSQTLQSM